MVVMKFVINVHKGGFSFKLDKQFLFILITESHTIVMLNKSESSTFNHISPLEIFFFGATFDLKIGE